jgi:serine/threonine protein kinase
LAKCTRLLTGGRAKSSPSNTYAQHNQLPSNSTHISQIDLEDSSEELADIQAEISLLSTCHSPYITEYKTSFVKGVKLWIVMEFLGGGSAADMV